jgi:hypothetical protein
MELAGEPRIQPPHDLAARMQSLLLRPGTTVVIPGLSGGRPPLLMLAQPARLNARDATTQATGCGGSYRSNSTR